MLFVGLSAPPRHSECFSPTLRHGNRGWVTQPAAHWVSCHAEPWPWSACGFQQSQPVLNIRVSLAAGLTIQIKDLASYWPIPSLAIAGTHARSCCLFLKGGASVEYRDRDRLR